MTEVEAEPRMDQAPIALCERCKEGHARALHPCPMKMELGGDETTMCTCCDDCRRQCASDI